MLNRGKRESNYQKTEPDLFAAQVKPDTSALIHFQAGLSLPGHTPQEPGCCSPPRHSWDSRCAGLVVKLQSSYRSSSPAGTFLWF